MNVTYKKVLLAMLGLTAIANPPAGTGRAAAFAIRANSASRLRTRAGGGGGGAAPGRILALQLPPQQRQKLVPRNASASRWARRWSWCRAECARRRAALGGCRAACARRRVPAATGPVDHPATSAPIACSPDAADCARSTSYGPGGVLHKNGSSRSSSPRSSVRNSSRFFAVVVALAACLVALHTVGVALSK